MSLKGVELQIAIPKTFDAGKMADQSNQSMLSNQASAANASSRQLEKNRASVVDSKESEKTGQFSENSNQQFSDQNKKESNEENAKMEHPYKGNFFDFSG
ncbi:hypothetical protein [Paenisporosarcina cavernae]|uniref:RNA polymerase subunit sigma n=1 Tax=Paenisporosarcina cavernae TaxID=2320858 RepID=A0A385YRP5_9BACL|nr:hypothetical protein [Paenisporosarcina cavernae]AYC29266.1 hypothetical protein D3873_04990 [Paenisporosarcina cavernae]